MPARIKSDPLREAKAEGEMFYYTAELCVRGHDAVRRVSSRACVECAREKKREWRAENLEASRESTRKSVAKHYARIRTEDPERWKKMCHDNYHNYREQAIETNNKWRKANLIKVRGYLRDFKKRHPDRVVADAVRYQVKKINACPTWVDHKAIRKIYTDCAKKTKATGIPHEVDHIVPLRGKYVSGLHVPWNLQILTAEENNRKGNRVCPTLNPASHLSSI